MTASHKFALDDHGNVHLRIRLDESESRKRRGIGKLVLHTSGRTRDEALLIALAAALHEKLRREEPNHSCALCEKLSGDE